MKYSDDNALGILKNSLRYVILWRHDAERQRMIGTKLRFRTNARRHSRYNRYSPTANEREARSGHSHSIATSPL